MATAIKENTPRPPPSAPAQPSLPSPFKSAAMSLYPLNHSELSAEIERLEWNHHNVYVPMSGNTVVAPEVDAYLQGLVTARAEDPAFTGRPPVSVADIGTGTGVWLVDLASSLPPTARLDGYDFNTSKFRPAASRPPNVQLLEANAAEPFAAELQEQYDLVHVRLLVLGLKSSDWQPLAANLRTLLRPGGYLVWEEIDVEHFAGFPEDSELADAMRQMLRFYKARSHQGGSVAYPIGLDTLLTSENFEDARQDVFKASDFWDHPTLFGTTMTSLHTIAASYMQGMVHTGGFEDVQTKEDAVRKSAAVKAALDAKTAKADFWFWRTTARKPL
ncbi:uncharacterized protein SPSK_03468 [Sporothrix schenckii 1099-18]|uniref:Methyltransferase domain-containing protein n=1 Tax=Sporothrix schenckii 1099-18 TaxID=1397361 RepID=A0A0F2M0X8_SPOSC|nr:uncharacterized protein SPSK_03468 [Sporothrix schenckii 1099-18]KJR82410.1 hypothetical protein SPSK_03468 [Sporothrix schenckii 1099-18]